jgi:NADH-quinone oxidoreductase subunit L
MQHFWLIPALPFAGFLINGLFGRRLSKNVVTAVSVGSVILSFLWVVKTLLGLGSMETATVEHYFDWMNAGPLQIGFDFSIDRLTAVMLLIVTGVGSLIHVYSIGYMAEEGGYYRFFAYMNLFMFFMLTLVLAGNYLLLFVGWEGVGMCSYLLIGFFFTHQDAVVAGKKAFVVNRVGDFGFALALFLIFVHFGSLDFAKVFEKVGQLPVESGFGILTIIGLLLLMGATGKSAQIPLFVWLPDAMLGPTPVSALIHAATMVTAGVYMTARSIAIFNHAPIAGWCVAAIGACTALFAASIAMTQYDIKKVYAYSTISQLGYMFLGCGVGAYSAGIYHVMTHAFFKALLFLGAGSVMHSLHGELDMRKMGGLRSKLPVTFMTLICASLSISGVPFTAGYFSKDLILDESYAYAPWMYWVGTVAAFMTAFYIWRVLFMTFFGKYKGDRHPHESPLTMTIPLGILALLALVGGVFNIPHFLEPVLGSPHEASEHWLRPVSASFGLFGIFLAWLFYVAKPGLPDKIAGMLGGFYRLVYEKYLVDELYEGAVVHPIHDGSNLVLWKGLDLGIIDRCVNAVGARSRNLGGMFRLMQSGYIRNYAAWVLAGCVIVVVAITFLGGVR